MIVERVRNESVWKSLKILFLGAALLLLINIYFGFDNSLTVGEIARGQILIHLHAGSVGWITLSAIGIAVWVLTGQREVSEQYARRIRLVVWAAVLAFALYIPNFWLAFSAGFATLLPVFGGLSVIVLWIAGICAYAAAAPGADDHGPVVGRRGPVGRRHRGHSWCLAGDGVRDRSLSASAGRRSRGRPRWHDGHLTVPGGRGHH